MDPLEAACARGDVTDVRRLLQDGVRPTHAFCQARGYEHLTVADLAHGAFTRDPLLYLRSQKPGVDVQLHRLLAAADPAYIAAHAELGPVWTEQAARVLSDGTATYCSDGAWLDWPAPAPLPAEVAWGERELALESVFDAVELDGVLAGTCGANLSALSLSDGAPPAEDGASTIADLPSDLVAHVLQAAAGGSWLRMLDFASVCREWRSAAIACARRPPLEMGALKSTLHRTLVTAPHVTPPRPTRKLAVVTNCGEDCELPSPWAQTLASRAWNRARRERAQREASLSWSATTCTDARRTRWAARVGRGERWAARCVSAAQPPPLAPCSVRDALRGVRDILSVLPTAEIEAEPEPLVDASNGDRRDAAAELRAHEAAVADAVARWLLQSGLRCVLARASVRKPAPEWWDDVFGPRFAHELVEERLVLIGAGAGGPRFAGVLARVRGVADADEVLGGVMGPC